jgi:hypothetical protein
MSADGSAAALAPFGAGAVHRDLDAADGAQLEFDLVDITPAPVFARLERLA